MIHNKTRNGFLKTNCNRIFMCVLTTTLLMSQASAQDTTDVWIDPDPLADVLAPLAVVQQALAEQTGLEVEFGYTMVGQFASRAEDDARGLLSGSFDVSGLWSPITDGSLGFLVEGGQIIDHNRSEDLSANIGSGLGVNDDLDNTAIAVTELWWEHLLFDGAVTVTLGKIDQTVFFDANALANDETAQFLATPLVNSVAVAFPDNGPGAVIRIDPCEHYYVQLGVGHSEAVATRASFDTLSRHHLFGAVEIGLKPEFADQPGEYRLMLWNTQADDVSSRGFSISCDQHVTERVIVFARFSDADRDVVDFKRSVSAGCGLVEPIGGRPDDLLATGFAWADPSDPTRREETILETFYRAQITESVALTGDVQLVLNPADAAGDEAVVVFGFRMQITQ